MYKGNIPFNPKTGKPMSYAENGYAWVYQGQTYDSWMDIKRRFGEAAVKAATRIDVPPDWRPNQVFRAILMIDNVERGRSAARFILKDKEGVKYVMFMTDMLDLLKHGTVGGGKTEYVAWRFCKRGQNYGIQLHRE